MIRLGHISFFGIGFINIFFALTLSQLAVAQTKPLLTSSLLVIARK